MIGQVIHHTTGHMKAKIKWEHVSICIAPTRTWWGINKITRFSMCCTCWCRWLPLPIQIRKPSTKGLRWVGPVHHLKDPMAPRTLLMENGYNPPAMNISGKLPPMVGKAVTGLPKDWLIQFIGAFAVFIWCFPNPSENDLFFCLFSMG